MKDHLASLSPQEVARFYRRLAQSIQKQFNNDSLAAMLLLYWLDGGKDDKVKYFPARYVKDLPEVRSYLRDIARPVFLSQRPIPGGTMGGVLPRIRGTIKSVLPAGPYAMHLEGNVETPLSVKFKAAMGMKIEPRQLDALYALHGFTLRSEVVVTVNQATGSRRYIARFDRWICKTKDYYHWNPNKYITVPNPDCGSKDPNAIAPEENELTVYHSNAIRVEKAGLAHAFSNESEPWQETDQSIIGPATIG